MWREPVGWIPERIEGLRGDGDDGDDGDDDNDDNDDEERVVKLLFERKRMFAGLSCFGW